MKGLIIGSFNPVHNGHIGLFQRALKYSEHLYILFCYEPDEKIAAILRRQWLHQVCRELEGGERIHLLEVCEPRLPYDKVSNRQVSKIWADYILEKFGYFDIIFGSEAYVEYVAEYMHCKAHLFDAQRLQVPVSSTLIREHPFRVWEHIPPAVRPHWVKKICLFGSESTGKTSMAQILAKHYQTEWVAEMARDFLGERKCVYADFEPIAYLQTGAVLHKQLTANKLLICDSDLIITELYARIYFNDCPQLVLDLQKVIHYDLYLFFEIDVPWVSDGTRDLGAPEIRTQMRDLFQNALLQRNIPFVSISGDWATREMKCIQAIDEAFMDLY